MTWINYIIYTVMFPCCFSPLIRIAQVNFILYTKRFLHGFLAGLTFFKSSHFIEPPCFSFYRESLGVFHFIEGFPLYNDMNGVPGLK